MVNYLADSCSDIARRMHDIRKEEGRQDDNWRTATGDDLENIAESYGLKRDSSEADDNLRTKIEDYINGIKRWHAII